MNRRQPDTITIRPEQPGDIDAIRRIITAAFSASPMGYHGEAELVDCLRSGCGELLSLVAVADRSVTGHVLFSPVVIRTRDREFHGSGLAPVGVAPQHQRSGVGTALIEHGIGKLESGGCPFIVLIGDPEYYHRFGFEPASHWQLRHLFDGIPQDVLMIRWLDGPLADSAVGGTVHYREEFGGSPDSREAE